MGDARSLVCCNSDCGNSDIKEFGITCEANIVPPQYTSNGDFLPANSNDYVVCTVCGTVQSRLSVEEFNVYDSQGKKFELGNRHTFKRVVHFNERARQFQRNSPDIPHDVQLEIIEESERLVLKDPFYALAVKQNKLTKRDIQKLLRSLDRRNPGKKYCRLYLEKWTTICDGLCDKQIPLFTPDKLATFGAIFTEYSDIWDQWQKAKPQSLKKFKHRSHFPNYNFMFQQILKMCSLEKEFARFFPLPTTRGANTKLRLYFSEMCKEMKRRGKYLKELDKLRIPLKRYRQIPITSLYSSRPKITCH
jgi:hypothetical protein